MFSFVVNVFKTTKKRSETLGFFESTFFKLTGKTWSQCNVYVDNVRPSSVTLGNTYVGTAHWES